MKVVLAALVALGTAIVTCAQEAEVEPIVVTGTFELTRRPSVTDLFTQHLLKQLDTKQTLDEMMARSPWYYSPLWKYFPIQIQSSSLDSAQFFAPKYLDLEYQRADQALRKVEKQSVFER